MKLEHKIDKEQLYFISDTHFYHENIIDYCNRPFKNVEEMNHTLITNWNQVIQSDSIVIIGGDFIFSGSIEKIKTLLDNLKGIKILVFGNHDYQNKLDREIIKNFFNITADALDFQVFDEELEDKMMKFHITHYPNEFWTRGAIHLHGHIHSGPFSTSSEKTMFKPMRYDIGVDNNDFKPISYKQIKTIITKQLLGYAK